MNTDALAHEEWAKSWLLRISNGDQMALEGFYRHYESSVYRFALNKLNQPADAADILNEVMVEVWKCSHRFEGRSKISTWLLGITRYRIYDRLRKKSRCGLEQDIDDFCDTLTDQQPNMEVVMSAMDDKEKGKHCIEKLSDHQREVIHLAFF